MRCEMHEESDELRPPALPHHRTATSSTFPRGEHLPKDSILALPSPCCKFGGRGWGIGAHIVSTPGRTANFISRAIEFSGGIPSFYFLQRPPC